VGQWAAIFEKAFENFDLSKIAERGFR